MTRHESEKRRELRFVCPKCKSQSLCTRNEVEIEIDHVYEDGGLEFGGTTEDEMVDFHCGGCGYVLVLDRENEEELHEWLLDHCSQDEPDSRESGDQASEVPPSERDK